MKLNRPRLARWGMNLVAASAIATGLAWGAANYAPPRAPEGDGCGMMASSAQGGGCCATDHAALPATAPQAKVGGKTPAQAKGSAACPMDPETCAKLMKDGECQQRDCGHASPNAPGAGAPRAAGAPDGGCAGHGKAAVKPTPKAEGARPGGCCAPGAGGHGEGCGMGAPQGATPGCSGHPGAKGSGTRHARPRVPAMFI